MNCSRAVKITALGLAITITIAAKVIAFNRVDPATSNNLQDMVVTLLSREGFQTQVSDRFGFVIDAERSNCRLQVRETNPAGSNLDANSLSVPKGTSVAFVYRGELMAEHPTLRVSISRAWYRLMWRLGVDVGWSPAIMVAAAGDCRLERLPWNELAEIHAH